jgi:bacterial SH3 domain protein
MKALFITLLAALGLVGCNNCQRQRAAEAVADEVVDQVAPEVDKTLQGHTFFSVHTNEMRDTLLFQPCDAHIPAVRVKGKQLVHDWGQEDDERQIFAGFSRKDTLVYTVNVSGAEREQIKFVPLDAQKKFWYIGYTTGVGYEYGLFIDSLYSKSLPYKEEACPDDYDAPDPPDGYNDADRAILGDKMRAVPLPFDYAAYRAHCDEFSYTCMERYPKIMVEEDPEDAERLLEQLGCEYTPWGIFLLPKIRGYWAGIVAIGECDVQYCYLFLAKNGKKVSQLEIAEIGYQRINDFTITAQGLIELYHRVAEGDKRQLKAVYRVQPNGTIKQLSAHKVSPVYTINDRDGYTNIRKGKGTNTPVIGKVDDGDTVEVLSGKGDWYLIRTHSGVEGYVHRSRVIQVGDEPEVW